MKLRTALGMMSGTSMDGIDVALLRTDGRERVERGPSGFFAYDGETRQLLEKALGEAAGLSDRAARPGSLKAAEAHITRLHGEAASAFLADQRLEASQVDVLGLHGQTVVHRPEDAFTVQLGDGAKLAQATGIPVVYDMRANDMANKGQGAPLAPAYHQALSRGLEGKFSKLSPIAFVNIGGIANITFIGSKGALIAFDSGPGNALIDQWVTANGDVAFDEGGAIAARGTVNQKILTRYLVSDYLAKSPPKSLDRRDFPPLETAAASLEDGARTLARLSAESIFGAARFLPETPALWIICGGGRHNRVIMDDLKTLGEAQSASVISAESAGFDGDGMEAEAWAYLAVRSLERLPLTWPSTTGVRTPVTGGVLARPQ